MKIVVRTPNWIGDVLMAFPAIDSLARAVPEAEIWIAARPWVKDLFVGTDYANGSCPSTRRQSPGLRRSRGGPAAAPVRRRPAPDELLLVRAPFPPARAFPSAGVIAGTAAAFLLTRGVARKDGGRTVHMVRLLSRPGPRIGPSAPAGGNPPRRLPDEKERARSILRRGRAPTSPGPSSSSIPAPSSGRPSDGRRSDSPPSAGSSMSAKKPASS